LTTFKSVFLEKWEKILTKTFDDTVKELGISGNLVVTGSYRREKPNSGDIDILITTDVHNKDLMNKFYNNLISTGIVAPENVISKGPVKIMAVAKINSLFRHLDIFYYPKDVYPFALLFTTGSKELNTTMRSNALKLGYSLNERNLTHGSPSGQQVSKEEYLSKIKKDKPETEEDIFKFLGMKYLEPKER